MCNRDFQSFLNRIIEAKECVISEQEEYVQSLSEKLSEETKRLIDMRKEYCVFTREIREGLDDKTWEKWEVEYDGNKDD